MRRLACVCALVLSAMACRRKASTPAPIVRDPEIADATTTPSPTSDSPLVLLHARVIDLRRAVVATELDASSPRDEVLQRIGTDDGSAYLLSKDGTLAAYDVRSAKLRWKTAAGYCSLLEATPAGAVCGGRGGVVLFEAQTGATRSISAPTPRGVTQLLSIEDGARLLVAFDDRTVESRDGRTLDRLGAVTLPFVVYGATQGLVESDDGACAASTDDDLHVACVDARAASSWTKTYPLRAATDPAATWFEVRALDRKFVLASASNVSTSSTHVARSVVVRLDDGREVARVEDSVAAAVRGEDGALTGLLATRPATLGVRYLSPSGVKQWSVTGATGESARTLLVGPTLVVAFFDVASTGADLRAFDVTTGAPRWQGDVELKPIAHSRYHTDVQLSQQFGRIVLRGRESGQSYLELFSPSDGARVFSELRAFW